MIRIAGRFVLGLCSFCICAVSIFGCSDDKSTTTSDPGLIVTRTVPADGARQVPVDAGITIEFNNALDSAALDSSWIILTGNITGELSCSGEVLHFTPAAALDSNTQYAVTLNKAIADLYGNTLMQDVTFEFRTADSTGYVWHEAPSTTISNMHDVTWGNGLFVMVGEAAAREVGAIYTSSDGVYWTPRVTSTDGFLYGVVYFKGRFVAVGSRGLIMRSQNGSDWEKVSSGVSGGFVGIAASGNTVVAISSGTALVSADGLAWTSIALPDSVIVTDIGWTGSKFVVTTYGDDSPVILTSADGSNWYAKRLTTVAVPRDELYCVAASDTLIVAAGPDNGLVTSVDGNTWTLRDIGLPPTESVFFKDIIWDGDRFIAVGGSHLAWGPFVAMSADGIDWQFAPYVDIEGGEFTAVAWSGERLVAATYNAGGRIYYTP